MVRKNELIAGLFCLTAATTWGLNFHLIKVMLQESAALEAGLWRYIFAVVPLSFLLYKNVPKWTEIQKNWAPILVIGFAGLFLFNFLLFVGMSYTSAVNAGLIAALTPALTLVFSAWMLKTPIYPRQILGVTIALFGAVYLISKGELNSLGQLSFSIGDLIMVAAAIMFAFHNVWVKQYSGRLSNSHLTFFTNFVVMLGFLAVFWLQPIGDFTTYSTTYWLSSLGVGFLGTSLAYYLWNQGIAQIGAPKAGIFLNAVPLSAAFFALFFGETLYTYHWISAAIIIGGVLVLQVR
ncbi:MAG: DMT family transporter [Bacteroidota bacterium]